MAAHVVVMDVRDVYGRENYALVTLGILRGGEVRPWDHMVVSYKEAEVFRAVLFAANAPPVEAAAGRVSISTPACPD